MADAATTAARTELERLIAARVPASVCNGSYNRSVDYKAAIGKARAALNARNSTLLTLQSTAAALRAFNK